MNDTPRTDANAFPSGLVGTHGRSVVTAEFAQELERELIEARKDTERLNWMDQTQNGVFLMVHFEWKPTTMPSPDDRIRERVVDGWCAGENYEAKESVRAAIDAARKES